MHRISAVICASFHMKFLFPGVRRDRKHTHTHTAIAKCQAILIIHFSSFHRDCVLISFFSSKKNTINFVAAIFSQLFSAFFYHFNWRHIYNTVWLKKMCVLFFFQLFFLFCFIFMLWNRIYAHTHTYTNTHTITLWCLDDRNVDAYD